MFAIVLIGFTVNLLTLKVLTALTSTRMKGRNGSCYLAIYISDGYQKSTSLKCTIDMPQDQRDKIFPLLFHQKWKTVLEKSHTHITALCLKCYNVDLLLQKISVTGNQKQYGIVYTNPALKRSICSCFRFLENVFFISVMLFTSYQ